MTTTRLGRPMAMVDELLEGNASWLESGWDKSFGDLSAPPARKLAVVACMDCRYPVEQVLGLAPGDAKIIRNAGNHLDDGTLRSLVVAVYKLGVEHIAVMGHTDCGMTTIGQGEFEVAHRMAKRTGLALHELMRPGFQQWLGGIEDVRIHVKRGVDLVKAHPYMPNDLDVFGLLYDNATGRVERIGP